MLGRGRLTSHIWRVDFPTNVLFNLSASSQCFWSLQESIAWVESWLGQQSWRYDAIICKSQILTIHSWSYFKIICIIHLFSYSPSWPIRSICVSPDRAKTLGSTPLCLQVMKWKQPIESPDDLDIYCRLDKQKLDPHNMDDWFMNLFDSTWP